MTRASGALNAVLKNQLHNVPDMNIGQTIKVKIGKEDKRQTFADGKSIISGKIIFKNNRYITVQSELYKQSINFTDFQIGIAKLLKITG